MNMKRIRWNSLVCLLAAFVFCTAPAQEVRPTAASRHTLWKVSGRKSTVYLLGSMHFLRPDSYPLAAPITQAFSNAAIAAFEADIDQLDAPAVQMKLLSKATLPPGQTLRQQLSPQTYRQFSNQVAQAGLPLLLFDSFKPLMAAMTLELLELQKLGYSPEQGVDKHFHKLARECGKAMVSLETVDFQIDLITGLSKEEGEMMVKTTLEEIDTTKKQFADLLKAWQTGDAAGLEDLLNTARREAPAVFKRMVADRTARWVPKVEELLDGGKTAIVIVGAGHLVGKDGLVELLRNKGLTVTQE
jgi:uncharacterized protein YbaP (TraB family)